MARMRPWLVSLLGLAGLPWMFGAAMRAQSAQDQLDELRRRDCDEMDIRQSLLSNGHTMLGPGVYSVCEQIVLTAGMTLEGAGRSTVLQWNGAGDYAVRIGEPDQTIFACHLRNLTIRDGGLLVKRAAASNTVENVWIADAPADGVRVQAAGEWTVFRDITAYGSGRNGFHVLTSSSNTGFVFDHCQAQNNGGAGFRVATLTPWATLGQVTLRDCVTQANGQDENLRDAEICLKGYVVNALINNCWIGDTLHTYGIRTYKGAQDRRVTGLTISNVNMANIEHALLLYAAPQCFLDSLRTSSSVGDVLYYRFEPQGLKRLSPGAVIRQFDPNAP